MIERLIARAYCLALGYVWSAFLTSKGYAAVVSGANGWSFYPDERRPTSRPKRRYYSRYRSR